jgi:peptidoglycan/LPS O-acetylase OafA/YrhL
LWRFFFKRDSGKPMGPSHGVGNSGGVRRIAAIDGLRGILATIVVVRHVCMSFDLDWMQAPADFAVETFFLLSGYVLTRAWDGRFGIFLIRRFLRLWPVYAFCLAIGYGLAGIRPAWSEFFWYPFMETKDLASIDLPMWSLFIEVWMMPFMPLIVWAGAHSPKRAVLTLLPVMILSHKFPLLFIFLLFVVGAFFSRYEFRNRLLETRVPQWLGKISYSLYLSHVLVFELATNVIGSWGAVIAIPAAFAVGWLIWWGIERHSIRASRRIVRIVEPLMSRLDAARAAALPKYVEPAKVDGYGRLP